MTNLAKQPASHLIERLHRILNQGRMGDYHDYYSNICNSVEVQWDIEQINKNHMAEWAIVLMAESSAERKGTKQETSSWRNAFQEWLQIPVSVSDELIQRFTLSIGFGGRAWDLLQEMDILHYPDHAVFLLVIAFRNDYEQWNWSHADRSSYEYMALAWLLLVDSVDMHYKQFLLKRMPRQWSIPDKDAFVDTVFTQLQKMSALQSQLGLTKADVLKQHSQGIKNVEEVSLYGL